MGSARPQSRMAVRRRHGPIDPGRDRPCDEHRSGRVASPWSPPMIARDFASPVRAIDRGFIDRHRAKGTPEVHIARMGGWCLADVQAVPHAPAMVAVVRPEPKAAPSPKLEAMAIPEVAEILRHIAE